MSHLLQQHTPSEYPQIIMEFEQLLNAFSGKRYHVKAGDDWEMSLIEVVRIGEEKIIVEGLTVMQMYAYLKRNIIVSLKDMKEK